MKKWIHPQYYNDVKVKCICGNEFVVGGATVEFVKVESCPACHPTYTGKKETKIIKGRLQKIEERIKKSEELKKKLAKAV